MTSETAIAPERRTPKGAAAGVIDTIADAVTFVLQRPWLITIPIVIDLVLWLFLKMTLGPVLDNLIRLMQSSQVEGSDQIVSQLEQYGGQIMITDYLGAFVPTLLTGMSVDTIMGMLMLFVAPDGFGIPRADIYEPWQNGIIDTIVPTSAIAVPLVWLGVIILSSVAMVAFRVPIVRAIRGTTPTGIVQEIARSWVNFILYLLLIVVFGVFAFIPLALLSVLVPILGLSAAFLTSFALLIFGGMFGVYSLFAVDAMLVHRTNPVNGFRMSIAVGKAYFGQVARFAITCIFVMLATMRLWSELAGSAPGFIIALVGNAFIGTVLAAASIFFYTDRFRLVRAAEAGKRHIPVQR